MTAVKFAIGMLLVGAGLFSTILAIGVASPRAYEGTRFAAFSSVHVKFIRFVGRPRPFPMGATRTEIIGQNSATSHFDPWISLVESDQNLRAGVELIGAALSSNHR